MVKILSVISGSPAHKAKINPGDTLIAINGHPIKDVLDYQYYSTDTDIEIELSDRKLNIQKSEYDDLGLVFETYLMDKKQHCKNNCMFCFINQLPQGMRDTLYFKDDDARLSFLQGNYITLTNLSDEDVDRIIKMRLPMNISVHTTDPELRCAMTGNKNAGKCLSYLYKMAAAKIDINAQIVLVPGVNDGAQLERTLTDLCMLYPSVKSIACVPVGLTKFRDGLPEIKAFDKASASAAIDTIEFFGNMMYEKYGDRVVYPSDELYITAMRDLPDHDYYGDFDQYENGVGMCASLEKEFIDALNDRIDEKNGKDDTPRKLSVATGVLAAPLIKGFVRALKTVYPDTTVNVYTINNDFFGDTVTVAGLITAGDIIKQLTPLKNELGDKLLITQNMLRAEGDMFLDDKTPEDVENALGIKVVTVPNDGYELFSAMLD